MNKKKQPNYYNTKKSSESVLTVPLNHVHSTEQALRDYRLLRDKRREEQALIELKGMSKNGGFIGL